MEELQLEALPGAIDVQVRLGVRGIAKPLLDARVPRLVVAVQHYRRCDGVALFASDAGWRLVFVTGHTIAYLPAPGPRHVESVELLAAGVLDALVAAGGVVADVLPVEQEEVA